MTQRIIDLLSLANTWAQSQGFTAGVFFDKCKTNGVSFRNDASPPLSRFFFQISNDAAEDFLLASCDDAGVYQSVPLSVVRSSGIVSLPFDALLGGEFPWRNGRISLSVGASQGGIVFQNGLVFNWGNVSASSGAPAIVTLSYGYGTAHVMAVANGQAISERFSAERLNLGQVKVYTTSGGGTNVSWFSVGY